MLVNDIVKQFIAEKGYKPSNWREFYKYIQLLNKK